MKKKFLLTFIASIIVFVSCINKTNNKQPDLTSLIIKTLEKETTDDKEKQLYLFIADYSCIECINKEYININDNGISIAFRNTYVPEN
jgi:hypothetical protein